MATYTVTNKYLIDNFAVLQLLTPSEIAGLENSVPVRMIYIDDKSEVLFKSLAHAARNTRITQDSIKKSLNPLQKRKFKHDHTWVMRDLEKAQKAENGAHNLC